MSSRATERAAALLALLAKEVALGDTLIGIGGCRALASTLVGGGGSG